MNKTILAALAGLLSLSGCASQMAGSGPSAAAISESAAASSIRVADLTMEISKAVAAANAGKSSLSADFGVQAGGVLRVNPGDTLEVSIWEAPPAALFLPSGITGGQSTALPPQVVNADGEITVPFAGRVKAAGKTTDEIEAAIIKGLKGKAHLPQALVRIAGNATSDVTVVGEVAKSLRMPISPRSERLLDAIAAAGGTKAPVEKATVQIARGDRHRSVPLEAVIRDPAENVRLMPGDVVTVYHQPSSFTAMGAVAKVGEVPFEATGITLAQAVARAGGPLDNRANPEGIFLFRQDGVPTVYRVNLRDPASIVAMREFPMQDGDILYVANAPIAEFHKFMSVIASIVYPVASIRNLVQE